MIIVKQELKYNEGMLNDIILKQELVYSRGELLHISKCNDFYKEKKKGYKFIKKSLPLEKYYEKILYRLINKYSNNV